MRRNCPNCGKEIAYKTSRGYEYAIKNNTWCRSCITSNWSEESRNKISKIHRGKKLTESQKNKIRQSHIGKKRAPFSEECKLKMKKSHLGKKMSDETKLKLSNRIITDDWRLKLRLARIRQIERDKFEGNQIVPSYNKKACQKIDEYANKHGYNFQHAMNGGEYYISQLGYWVDGYDKTKNVVIEYYEDWHNLEKFRIKDDIRKKNIIDYLKCVFIIIKENGEVLFEQYQ